MLVILMASSEFSGALVFLVVLYYTMIEDGYEELSVRLFAQVEGWVRAFCR